MAWYRVLDKIGATGQLGAAISGGMVAAGVWFYGMRMLVRWGGVKALGATTRAALARWRHHTHWRLDSPSVLYAPAD